MNMVFWMAIDGYVYSVTPFLLTYLEQSGPMDFKILFSVPNVMGGGSQFNGEVFPTQLVREVSESREKKGIY